MPALGIHTLEQVDFVCVAQHFAARCGPVSADLHGAKVGAPKPSELARGARNRGVLAAFQAGASYGAFCLP
jgi:hypothetical protein